ncbi:asparagine synthase (glutamine-hydrolyzing) [Christiangramia fulva]|uniref:asparagine synthase (glutamine-hydrolyzing) n=1 Tax=Christiangramia fulva TaxID=2126553 RepID=A0A2R3Z0N1_9FLAO|nr:asparagine synthase (glutamine-hydrolyzing) [Christiangramia fulva]AVR43822.1 asparagine synthase (glutamine-hydrolyzing) [Christiangramia fulva]
MCGIAGIIGTNYNKEDLEKMLESIKHRGPDASGIYQNGDCLLGHNRLSIIDLSTNANQPFSDTTGRFQLIFNGEIYNYKELKAEIGDRYNFRTSSDTEVLLASYIIFGKDCLEKLNGMFAFAIWDKKKKELFAARDRFGVKPFYYYKDAESFIFASEIKAIHRFVEKNPDEKTWANYFCYGSYGSPETTFYKDIFQLQAGYYLEFKDGKLQKHQWYDFEKRIKEIPSDHGSDSEVKRKYLALLEDSIKLRFRADVEVGFNLSGGVDSSLLLALVNHLHPTHNIKAYTFYTGDERYDELPWVEKMIKRTGNSLEKVKLSPEEVPELSERISFYQDEPYGGIPTLAYSKIFQKASKDGVKVLLDGQGMDEQWAGYDYYGRATNELIQGSGNVSPLRTGVLNKGFMKLAEKPQYPELFSSVIQNLQYRDLFNTKLPRALRFNDRISMAYSTELREPFLDYRLVEMAFALPDQMKIRGGVHKYMLREIVKEYVPFEIAEAPKRALQTPQREWLGEELRGFVNQGIEKLLNSEFSNWFDSKALRKEWEAYQNGKQENSFYVWQWVNLGLLI